MKCFVLLQRPENVSTSWKSISLDPGFGNLGADRDVIACFFFFFLMCVYVSLVLAVYIYMPTLFKCGSLHVCLWVVNIQLLPDLVDFGLSASINFSHVCLYFRSSRLIEWWKWWMRQLKVL